MNNDSLITALRKIDDDTPVKLTISESKDREMNKVWDVDVITEDGIEDTIEYYNEQEAIDDMDECEDLFSNVTID